MRNVIYTVIKYLYIRFFIIRKQSIETFRCLFFNFFIRILTIKQEIVIAINQQETIAVINDAVDCWNSKYHWIRLTLYLVQNNVFCYNNTNLVDELKKRISAQENELSQKNKQILAKDSQLENMQKLLDQSQQLQLMAENKLEKLEPPQNDPESGSDLANDQTHERAPEAPVKAESSPEQPPSFWQRLFGTGK